MILPLAFVPGGYRPGWAESPTGGYLRLGVTSEHSPEEMLGAEEAGALSVGTAKSSH